jgi:hypothetical protein
MSRRAADDVNANVGTTIIDLLPPAASPGHRIGGRGCVPVERKLKVVK